MAFLASNPVEKPASATAALAAQSTFRGIQLSPVLETGWGEKALSYNTNQTNFCMGEIHCLEGDSGVGKTTLLLIISLLSAWRGGEVTYTLDENNPKPKVLNETSLQDTRQGDVIRALRQQFGGLFQDALLVQRLTNLENILHFSHSSYKNIQDLHDKVKYYYEKLEFNETKRVLPKFHIPKVYQPYMDDDNKFALLFKMPSEVSGGERRRFALIRALASNPTVLVADEPTAGVDSSAAKAIMETIESWVSADKQNRMAILSSHSKTVFQHSKHRFKLSRDPTHKNTVNIQEVRDV